MAATKVAHPSVADRRAKGADARIQTPPELHAGWVPAADRPDPVALLEEQNATREPDLVPVRHGRMMVSPFTFYRGAAKIMATDLAGTPTAGLTTQLCGDAHLSNFGVFASPERRLLFDLNDFDETLPGPFEYDVKRMAASFTIAARNNGLTTAEGVRSPGRGAGLPGGDGRVRRDGRPWKSGTPTDLRGRPAGRRGQARRRRQPRQDRTAPSKPTKKGQGREGKPARTSGRRRPRHAEPGSAASRPGGPRRTCARRAPGTACRRCPSSVNSSTGAYRIVSQPPIVVPIRDLEQHYGMTAEDVERRCTTSSGSTGPPWRTTGGTCWRRFQVIDMARKVVGVGSVGTRAFIVLLQGRDDQDPLFLQVKEATRSVLEDHLPKSRYHNPGERVVRGQRMMQAASDIFLGWTKGVQADRYLYWRQLRDMKGSALVDTMSAVAMQLYAGLCGWTLARAHARSGDAVAIDAPDPRTGATGCAAPRPAPPNPWSPGRRRSGRC